MSFAAFRHHYEQVHVPLCAGIVANYLNSEAEAVGLRAEIDSAGGKAALYRTDFAEAGSARMLVEFAVAEMGHLDILVNNAGIVHLQTLGARADWAASDRICAVNLQAAVEAIRAAAEVMEDGGRIINIGSVSGTRAGMAGAADYCGSKAALAGYTRGAARDLAPRGITVNIIEPGMMNTEMAHHMPDEDKSRILAGIPLQRFGALNEIAELACFLVDGAANYITGSTLTIDGGLSA